MQQFNMKQKEKYKETELGLLPESWEVLEIGDVTNVVNKKGEIGRLPYVEIGDININSKNYSYKDKKSIKVCKKAFKDNFIISIVRPTRGAISIIKEEEIEVSSALAILSEKSRLNIKYFFLVLACNKNFFEYMKKVQRGSNYPSCRKEDILKFKIPLPSLPEQKKIANVLSTIQEAKEKAENVINSLKELKKSMTDHFFTYGPINLKEAGKIELKETENVRFSSNWKCKPLAECVDNIEYGHSISIPANINPKGVYIISTADITKDGRLLYNKVRKINSPKKISDRLLLRQGDILFNWRNSPELVGKTTIFQEGILSLPVIYASFVLRIRTDEEKSHNVYFKYLLNYYREKGIFIKLARRAVNQANYNRNEINKLMVPFPEFQIQKQIAFLLTKVDEKIAFEENKKKALEELFKSTLHNLMTAKIRVNHLEI